MRGILPALLLVAVLCGAAPAEDVTGMLAALPWDAPEGTLMDSLGLKPHLVAYTQDAAILRIPEGFSLPSAFEGILVLLDSPIQPEGAYYLYEVADAGRADFSGRTRVLLRLGRTVVLWSADEPPRLTDESSRILGGIQQPVRITWTAKVLTTHLRSRKDAPGEFQSVIEQIVSDVDQNSYGALWQTLDNFETRYVGTPQNEASVVWILETLASYGLDVEAQEYQPGQKNVVGTLPGAYTPKKVVYMTAHLDSISKDNPALCAPGADDDASGVAAFLEAARVMSSYHFEHTIKFVGFNGEEVGIFGSGNYAAGIKDLGEDVIGCINLDMIAFQGNDPFPALLRIYTNPDSRELSDVMAASCLQFVPEYIEPHVIVELVTWSDHISFWNNGYKAITVIEESLSPWYHTCEDRIENYTRQYATSVTMAAVGAVAQLALPVWDCDKDGIPDFEEIAAGTAYDVDIDGVPDDCEPDCNSNGFPDDFDLARGTSRDCNGNAVPDECDVQSGTSADCNENGIPDDCDVQGGASKDCNGNGVPDECEPDCNGSGFPDDCDVKTGTSNDCNKNGLPDECDIASGRSHDCNDNGTPDECDVSPFPVRLAENTTGISGVKFLGPPDGINEGIGSESVTYDFGPAEVADGTGPDFSVYEGRLDFKVEFASIEVQVSGDGVNFTSVKAAEAPVVRISGDEAHKLNAFARSYDLGPSGLDAVRYIRIQGLTPESAGGSRGFDLDAVGAVHLKVCLPRFRRGDSNADGTTDIGDVLAILFKLFMTENIPCEQAGDVNDDGVLDISDAIYSLNYLFLGGKAIAPPVGNCGIDPTGHELPCESFPRCE